MSDTTTTRVVLIDNNALARKGLRGLLEAHPDLVVVGEADDPESGTELSCTGLELDVMVMNTLSQPGDPVQVMRSLIERCLSSSPRVLMLVDQPEPPRTRSWPRGAVGFLFADSSPQQFVSAVRMVAAGYSLSVPAGPPKSPFLCRANDSGTVADDRLRRLTKRETDVLMLITRGLSNAEISVELMLSESTVKSHIQRMLDKLELRNRVHAVIYAYEAGLTGGGAREAPCVACDSAAV